MAAAKPCTQRAAIRIAGIGCQRAGNRGRREDGKARDEYPLGADAVAERAGRQDEGGEGDGVGAHHPLQFGDAAAERGADGC